MPDTFRFFFLIVCIRTCRLSHHVLSTEMVLHGVLMEQNLLAEISTGNSGHTLTALKTYALIALNHDTLTF